MLEGSVRILAPLLHELEHLFHEVKCTVALPELVTSAGRFLTAALVGCAVTIALVTGVAPVVAGSHRRPGVVSAVGINSIARVASAAAATAAGAAILALSALVVSSGNLWIFVCLRGIVSDRACVRFRSDFRPT